MAKSLLATAIGTDFVDTVYDPFVKPVLVGEMERLQAWRRRGSDIVRLGVRLGVWL